MLPAFVKQYTGYINGYPMPGLIEEITLPKLTRKMDDYQGGGMLGPVSVDMGMDALKLELTFSQVQLEILRAFGSPDAGGILGRFVGAAVADDATATVRAIEITVRGRIKEIDKGSWKRGDRAKMKVDMPLVYFMYTENGVKIVEYDLINNIEYVNGVDRQAAVRAALGMS